MNIDQALQTALAHHRAGRLAQAESIYRHVLQHDPRNADALHLLGLLATQTGHASQGVDLIRQAIALAPGVAHYHSNLGKSLCALGRPDEAIASLREAVRLRPDDAEAWVNLGALLRQQRQPADAAAASRRALGVRPAARGQDLVQPGQRPARPAGCRRGFAGVPEGPHIAAGFRRSPYELRQPAPEPGPAR